jgi:asparagine synthase (glutamine-hydrolysing)
MSAVAGCYWLDGRPAGGDDLLESTTSARHRARRAFCCRAAGPAVVAYAADEDGPPQPAFDPRSRTTVIVDGPLDNLDEIARRCGVPPASSAGVALAAWQRWGVGLGAQFLGDFLIVVSDEDARRIVCIRAPLGQRPLFYGVSARAIVFGSEVQQVVRHPSIARDIDEGMIAEYLTAEPATVGDTLWRDVHRLPPAHTLEIGEAGARVKRYWDFDPGAALDGRNAAEHRERLRALVIDAVECRTRRAEQAGVYLSGGIDSSIVAGVAERVGSARGRPPVHAFTTVFPGRACDEAKYSQAVVDAWGLRATRAAARIPSRQDLIGAAASSFDVPPMPNSAASDPLRDLAAAAGVGVLLTGFGGDEFFTGDPAPHPLLRQGRVIAWSRAMASRRLPLRVRDLLRPVLGAKPPQRPWIRQAFAGRTALADRLRRPAPLLFPTLEQEEIHRGVNSLMQILGDEMEDRAAQASGVPHRHPFYDRRVAEFGLALPASERARGGETRIALRHACAEFLPPLVAARVTLADKAEFSSTYVDALEASGGKDAFARLRSEQAGWVDGGVLRRLYDEMFALYTRGDDAYIACINPLWAVMGLEFWLEACVPAVAGMEAG